jgi:hypothetical protein
MPFDVISPAGFGVLLYTSLLQTDCKTVFLTCAYILCHENNLTT